MRECTNLNQRKTQQDQRLLALEMPAHARVHKFKSTKNPTGSKIAGTLKPTSGSENLHCNLVPTFDLGINVQTCQLLAVLVCARQRNCCSTNTSWHDTCQLQTEIELHIPGWLRAIQCINV